MDATPPRQMSSRLWEGEHSRNDADMDTEKEPDTQ